MRNGSAAIVPLFIGIMLLFWAFIFLGNGGDTLHSVNKVENLNHLQVKLLIPVAKYKQGLEDAGVTDPELTEKVDAYVDNIMKLNNIYK